MLKPDQYYISKVLEGKTSSYSVLVDRHKQDVFGIVYKILQHKEDAEEVAQDVFVKAFKKLNSFKQDAKFATWLFRIAYNMSISSLRKKKFIMSPIDESIILNHAEDESIEKLERIKKETRERLLKKAILKLDRRDQVLLNLYYDNQVSMIEIASIMGLTPTNVKVKMYRARQQLYQLLEPKLKNNNTILDYE